MEVTETLLAELGCSDIPSIHVLNKSDLVDLPKRNEEKTVWISSKTGYGINDLLSLIARTLPQTARRLKLCIPYSEGGLLQILREEGKFFSEEYTETGILIDAMIDHKRWKQVQAFSITE